MSHSETVAAETKSVIFYTSSTEMLEMAEIIQCLLEKAGYHVDRRHDVPDKEWRDPLALLGGGKFYLGAWRILRFLGVDGPTPEYLEVQENVRMKKTKSEPPMALMVDHVAVLGSDLDATLRFYRDTLGFAEIRRVFREERRSWKVDLRVSARVTLEIFTFPKSPPRLSGPEACGLRHLAFRTDSLERMITKLEAAGYQVEPIRVDEFTGKRFTFVRDPDGLPVELVGE